VGRRIGDAQALRPRPCRDLAERDEGDLLALAVDALSTVPHSLEKVTAIIEASAIAMTAAPYA
jgi:hypothetical protein